MSFHLTFTTHLTEPQRNTICARYPTDLAEAYIFLEDEVQTLKLLSNFGDNEKKTRSFSLLRELTTREATLRGTREIKS